MRLPRFLRDELAAYLAGRLEDVHARALAEVWPAAVALDERAGQ